MRKAWFLAILTSSWRWLMKRLAALAIPALAALAMQPPAGATELGVTLYGTLRQILSNDLKHQIQPNLSVSVNALAETVLPANAPLQTPYFINFNSRIIQ
jgi:hypothetical protein